MRWWSVCASGATPRRATACEPCSCSSAWRSSSSSDCAPPVVFKSYVPGGSGDASAMRLADELLLLAYSEKGTSQLSQYAVDLGLGGAVLLELALAERFDVRDGKIVVVDPGPLGDPVLDDALIRVASDKKARSPRDWVRKLSDQLRERLLDNLVAIGVLARE